MYIFWLNLVSALAPGVLQILFVAKTCGARCRPRSLLLYLAGLLAILLAGEGMGFAGIFMQILLLAAVTHLDLHIPLSPSLTVSILAAALTWIPFGIVGSLESLLLPSLPPSLYPAVSAVGTAVSFCLCLASYAAASRLLSFGSRSTLPQVALLLIPTLFVLGTEVSFAHFFYSVAETDLSPAAAALHITLLILQIVGPAALLATLAAYCRLLTAVQTEADNQALQLAYKTQQTYVCETGQRLENTRSLRHDLRNHLLALRGLLAQEEYVQAAAYLDRLQPAAEHTSPAHFTGNAAVDTLIAAKIETAGADEIEIDVERFALPKDCIDDFDLCIVFANALDNAIAAARQTDGTRKITVHGKLQGEVLALYFENPCSRRPLPPAGMGRKNIRRVTEKYNGTSTLEATGGQAVLSVLLCISSQSDDSSRQLS